MHILIEKFRSIFSSIFVTVSNGDGSGGTGHGYHEGDNSPWIHTDNGPYRGH